MSGFSTGSAGGVVEGVVAVVAFVAAGVVEVAGGCVVAVAGATLTGVLGAGLLSPPIFCASAEPVIKVKAVMKILLRIIFCFLRVALRNEYQLEWFQEDFLKYHLRFDPRPLPQS